MNEYFTKPTEYNICCFHINRLNIDSSNTFIECYTTTHITPNLTKNTPICSTITYLSDDCPPILFSPFNRENYKYKEFPQENQIYISFAEKNKHIACDGSDIFGELNIFGKEYSGEILVINIYDKKPENIECFQFEEKDQDESFEITEMPDPEELILDTTAINFDFFEDFFYKKEKTEYPKLQQIFKNIMPYYPVNYKPEELLNIKNTTYKITTKTVPYNQTNFFNEKKQKYGNVMVDIHEVKVNEKIPSNNRFYRKHRIDRFYQKDICRWIIAESEKYAAANGGWTKKRHAKYPTTDIPANQITSIFGFLLISMETILSQINKLYGFGEITFNINDLFVVKYDENDQTELELHKDGSFISINIMLSDSSEYDGGGTHFKDDDKSYFLEQGDLLIHCGQLQHCGMKITKGKRYCLVGFIDIILS